jgi:hypothetical protein
MALVRWKLAAYLKAHNLTAYAVAKEMGGLTRIPTVYRMADGDKPLSRVDFKTLADLMVALRVLGHPVELSDLLEFDPDAHEAKTPGGGVEKA